MKKRTITLLSTLLIAGNATIIAQDVPRGPGGQGGNRERPNFFALADKDESATVSLDELVKFRIEMMSRRGERGQAEGRQGRGDPAAMATRVKEQLSVVFKKADTDENGELSKEEFAKMPQGRGPRGGAQRGPRAGGA
jgi:hypothetical protein